MRNHIQYCKLIQGMIKIEVNLDLIFKIYDEKT